MSEPGGIVAAGHPLSAEVGRGACCARAATPSMRRSRPCSPRGSAEPLLTGPGAGGYMLVAGAGVEPALLDFFVAAPGAGHDGDAAALQPYEVDFGDTDAGLQRRRRVVRRARQPGRARGGPSAGGRVPLADLAAPAAAMARDGRAAERASRPTSSTCSRDPRLDARGARRVRARPAGSCARATRSARRRSPRRSSASGPRAPRRSTAGDIAAAIVAYARRARRPLTRADLAAYDAVPREPVRARYRGREVLTNPPPSAGGILLALAMAASTRRAGAAVGAATSSTSWRRSRRQRTPEFLEGLAEPGFPSASSPRGWARRRTSRCSTARAAPAR